MIKLTKQAEYAISLLQALAEQGEGALLSLKQFSTHSSISFQVLQRVAQRLRRAGLIDSVQGAKGGYKLAKPMTDIHLKAIIDAVDGNVGVAPCVSGDSICEREATCSTKPTISALNTKMIQLLEQTTLETFSQ